MVAEKRNSPTQKCVGARIENDVTQWLDGHDHDEYEGSERFGDVVIAPED